jgi:uncharacterized protein
VLLLLAASSAWTAGATAQSDYGVYVRDEGGVLSLTTKNELYNRALWLKERTGTAQIGVVTVKSLEGRTIEEAAVDRFRKLGLGGKERNDGVLLLYSADDGRVRIEVGYGLEGRIPDGKAGAILDTYFVPDRNAGQLDIAFSRTQSAIVREVAQEYGLDASEVTNGLDPPGGGSQGLLGGVPGYVKVLLGAGLVLLIVLDFKLTGGAVTFFLLNLLGRRGGSGGGGYGGGRGGGGSSGGGGASR